MLIVCIPFLDCRLEGYFYIVNQEVTSNLSYFLKESYGERKGKKKKKRIMAYALTFCFLHMLWDRKYGNLASITDIFGTVHYNRYFPTFLL